MDPAQHARIVSFIWGIADEVLRDIYVRGKYRDVILPMTLIRRLDALLEPSKAAVLAMQKSLTDKGIEAEKHGPVLLRTTRCGFYNTSEFTLAELRKHPLQLRDNFESYINAFSPNVRDIIARFGFLGQIEKLATKKILDAVLEKFTSPELNFSPAPANGLPGMSNHDMGYVFEELLRRFNEENNEEAGEHFTPREVVRLMARLLFVPVADKIEPSTYLVYDCACGSGGMLTESEAMLQKLAAEHQRTGVKIHLYGQESNDETYAICKADMLLKGEDESNIRPDSTLSNDAFPRTRFDFMLANPPYGKNWKTDLQALCDGDKKEMKDPRFVVSHAGEDDFSLVTRSSDGQLMFLVNMLSKMKHDTALGSRVATIHNGSALFTGDAGQGESNIRRWIIENDWLEAIIALPLKLFYNTGIATYVWVLSNRKLKHREKRVQLIDATGWFRPLQKNLGQKSCELSPDDIARITKTYEDFTETPESKIFPNEAFGYWRITVERPLRLRVSLDADARRAFRTACEEAKDLPLADLIDHAATVLGEGPHTDWHDFLAALDPIAFKHDVKLNPKRVKLLQGSLAVRDPAASPVRRKLHKPGAESVDALHGRYEATVDGKRAVVEYEPDSELRDTEQVPLLEPGGIAAFVAREVIPHAPDAWVDPKGTEIGYEISFNRYFHKPQALRSLEEIRADILAVERETEGLLAEILGTGGAQ